MPNAGAKNFPLTYYYNPNRAKWPETELGNKKSSKSFSDLLLSLAAPVDGWYSVLKVSEQGSPMIDCLIKP